MPQQHVFSLLDLCLFLANRSLVLLWLVYLWPVSYPVWHLYLDTNTNGWAPVYAILSILLYTYRSSWGMIFHTENLMVFHLLVVAFCPAADVYTVQTKDFPWFNLDSWKRKTEIPEDGRYGWGIRLLCIVTTSSYFLAGVAKIKNAGWDWVSGDILRVHIAYDNLRKIEMGDWYAPLGIWLISYGWIFPILAVFTLLFELGSPLALFSNKVGRLWAIGIWSFHLGVVLMMAIVLFLPTYGTCVLVFFCCEA